MDLYSRKRAFELLEKGLDAVHRGNYRGARDFFRKSSEVNVTADALTYWGWMEHRLGNSSLAIQLCLRAIAIDPDFGNPYNDIGSYLLEQGKTNESIGWFKKAIRAQRYDVRQFPHMNLGRAFLKKAMPVRALREFHQALKYAQKDPELHRLVAEAKQIVN